MSTASSVAHGTPAVEQALRAKLLRDRWDREAERTDVRVRDRKRLRRAE